MAKSREPISRRIARDRGGAGFGAALAALVPFVATLGLVYFAFYELTHGTSRQSDRLASAGLIVLFAFLIWLITRWTYASAHAALTPQRVQAMWLRRFQTEKGARFRPSQEIDRLARYGISSLTLQDRDVQLSFEQRRNRLAPMFWLFFLPIAALLGVAGWTMFHNTAEQFSHPQLSPDLSKAFGQIIANFIAELVVLSVIVAVILLAFVFSLVLIMLLAAVSGPIGAMLSRNRDDFPSLPRLLDRIRHGKRARGAVVVRVSDAHWQEAVTSSLGVADAAIIDLSNVSGNIAWEIDQAAKACTPGGLVFIARADAAPMPADAAQALQRALGSAPSHIITYPATPGREARRFAQQLRGAIYAAVDTRTA